MSVPELLSLPVTVDLPTAGRAHGIGRSYAYELAQTGGLPFRVFKVGHKLRVTRADLLESLGIDPTQQVAQ